MKIPKREFAPIPEGIYIAKIINVDNHKALSDRFPRKDPDEPQYNIEFQFELVEDETGDTTYAKRRMWQTNHPYSKRNLTVYNAAMNEKLEMGSDGVEFDEMITLNKLVRLVIKNDMVNGNIKDKIDSILPLAKGYAPDPVPQGEEADKPEKEVLDSDLEGGGNE